MNHLHPIALSSALLASSLNVSWASQIVYVPLGDANQVQIIDLSTHKVIDSIKNVGNTHGLAMTPDEQYLVAGSFSESALNEASIPKPSVVSEAEHEKHHEQPTKEHARKTWRSYISIIDSSNREVVRRVLVPGAVHHLAVSPNGRYAVTTHPGSGRISLVDLEQFETVDSIRIGPAPNYAVFSHDGRTVYVSNSGDNSISSVDIGTRREIQRIKVGKGPEHVVLSPDGLTLYTNNIGDGTASAISLNDQTVTDTYTVGAAPHGIDLSDDGNTLFTTSKGDDRLVAIDLTTGKRREMTLTPAPYHLTTIRGENTIYISSRAENMIWVVN